jgi:23S rRNA (uracil1939-C5)-methyltransferase
VNLSVAVIPDLIRDPENKKGIFNRLDSGSGAGMTEVGDRVSFYSDGVEWQYRNKMEYSFWADDDGLHLALFNRGSHGKRIIRGSSIARPEIDVVANKICKNLNDKGIRGSQLKTAVIRCNQAGECVAAVFVKDEKFPKLEELASVCAGVAVYFSNPKSPASILTKELYSFGDTTLSDKVLNADIHYSVMSFFQVNLPVFTTALAKIKQAVLGRPAVDFYSGVGTIGIPIGATKLVESDPNNIAMAMQNAEDLQIEVVQATAETALDHIPTSGALIVDPPRAGLHQKVTEKIRENRPDIIVYLSCNPITQARDIALLQDTYELKSLTGYNFFPRTPHIESLAILQKRV